MANLQSIHAVGESLRNYLRNTYPSSAFAGLPTFDIQLISSGELATLDEPTNTLSLFLHRVTVNEHLRGSRPNHSTQIGVPLSVDLHYLMTVWANSALAEHLVLAWAMRQFHSRSFLDASSLSPEGGWQPEDTIQLIPVDLSNEDIMRIWDRLKPSYRLSVAYIARVVSIDVDLQEPGRPVVATRFGFDDREAMP